MAKDRITMIMAIVRKITIFHIITIMINTVLGRAGAVIIEPPGTNMTETMMIILLMTALIVINTETAANIAMMTTDTTVSTAGTIITDLIGNKPQLQV